MKFNRFQLFAVLMAAVGVAGAPGCGSDPVEELVDETCPDPRPVTVAEEGFPDLISPADNPLTREGIALGRRLFYETILSGDSTQSCGSCHLQQHAFGDPRRVSIGIDLIPGNRQAPTIINAGWLPVAFWDGRAASLEDQARGPVPNPIEMHLPWPDAVDRLAAHPEYPDLFCQAFGDPEVTQDRVVQAIAQFERTFVSANSPWDRFRREGVPLDPGAERGRQMFFTETGDCFHCHGQVIGFDEGFHNIGLDAVPVDRGLGAITGDPADDGKFKSPSLRNIMVSAPYMHDGRFTTIQEVLAHYNHGFSDGPNVDPLIRARLSRPPLTAAEIDTLIMFLHALTDTTFLNNPDLSDPFAQN